MADQYVVSTANSAMIDYPLYEQAVSGDPAIQYSAGDWRGLINAMYPKKGVLNPTSFTVTQRGAGANFSVDIGPLAAIIQGNTSTLQGSYFVAANGTVNLSTPSAPASGTRTHRVVAQILDKQSSGSAYGWQYHLVEDTGSGLPAIPNDSIDLATVQIASGQASVQNSNITLTWDLAGPWTGNLSTGGPCFVAHQTSSQTGIVPNTFTTMNFQSVVYDPMGGYSASTPSRYTVKVPGLYYVEGGVAWTTLNANTTINTIALAAKLRVNGSNLAGSLNGAFNTNAYTDTSVVMARPRLVQLSRGDYVEVQGSHSWSGNLDTQVSRSDCYSNLQLTYLG